ncbi:MAG: hypothetical protein ACR2QM_18535 [Longimicrobiales bacterium]
MSVLAERYDSAGTTVVLNRAQDRPLPWTLERLYSLGGADDGPESFYQLPTNAVATDAASNLYILDGPAHRVASFAPDGAYRFTVGGEGEGPGELQFPSGVSVAADGTISVFDFGKGALVRFGSDQSIRPQAAFQDLPVPVGQRHFVDLVDRMVVSTSRVIDSGREYVLKDMAAEDTVLIGSLPVVEPGVVDSEECGVRMRLPPLFAPRFVWDARGGRIVVAGDAAYSFEVLDEGSEFMRISRDLPTRSATESDAMAEIGEGSPVSLGGRAPCTISPHDIIAGRGVASEVPWIESIALTPWGEIWVERKTIGPDTDGPIDIFSESGEYVGTIAFPMRFPAAFLAQRRVAVVEVDELDVARLVVHAIVGAS